MFLMEKQIDGTLMQYKKRAIMKAVIEFADGDNRIKRAMKKLMIAMQRFDIKGFLIKHAPYWKHIIEAMRHENESLSVTMESLVEKIKDLGPFRAETARRTMIEALKRKKLTFLELRYVEAMWERVFHGEGLADLEIKSC